MNQTPRPAFRRAPAHAQARTARITMAGALAAASLISLVSPSGAHAATPADIDTPIACDRALVRIGRVDTGLLLRIRGVYDAGARRWVYEDASGTGRRSFSLPPGVYLLRFAGTWMGDMSVHAPAGTAITFDATVRSDDGETVVVRQFASPLDRVDTTELPAALVPASPLACPAPEPSRTAPPRVAGR